MSALEKQQERKAAYEGRRRLRAKRAAQQVDDDVADKHNEAFRFLSLIYITLTHSYTQIYIKTKGLTTHFAGKSQKRIGNEMTRKKQHRCHSQWASPSWPQSSGGSWNCMKRLRGWWLNFLLPTKGLMSRSAGYKNSLKKSVWWRKNLMGRWITWSLKRQPCQAHSEYRNVGKEKQILRSSKKEKLMLSRREEIEGNEIDCGYLTAVLTMHRTFIHLYLPWHLSLFIHIFLVVK